MPRTALPLGIALLFLLVSAAIAAAIMPFGPLYAPVILGAAAASYMAINIGANDVANNMGPAVGARALPMAAALGMAAVLDAAGALLAGGNVIDTVSNQLLTVDAQFSAPVLIVVMVSALLAAASWINLSTLIGAPVSTTHAIVGGVVGAAVAAGGTGAVAWPTIGVIATSWTLSPLLGGVIAAAIHAMIRKTITRRADKLAAARTWVPLLVAAMAGIFAMYLATRLNASWHPGALVTSALGCASAAVGFLVARPRVRRHSLQLENRKKQVARLFRAPLIVAAGMLCFAHGANDVANAVGPLLVIVRLAGSAPGTLSPDVPVWTLMIGAAGIALGIGLFGPRVIHTIGEQITKLNEIRAFCVALAAAITVLAASAFGLPISSTHVAVGAVFGVGFLREYLAIRNMKDAAVPIETAFVDVSLLNDTAELAVERERRYERRYLVRRLKVARIGAAWLITLPASAGLAALAYLLVGRFIA